MNNERRRLLAKVAYLYFIEGKSQTEIARDLNIYRTTISRMITKAKEEEIIKIEIKDYDEKVFLLEQYVQSKYNMKRIEIVENYSDQTAEILSEAISTRAASLIRNLITDQDIVGIAWGETLSRVIDKMEIKTIKEGIFCPLAGGPSYINTKYHVNTLVYELSRVFQGKTTFINATVVQESEEMAQRILKSEYFQELQALWSMLDLAIVGIGGDLEHNSSQWRDLLDQKDYQILADEQAVGEVCCRFFNQLGTPVSHQLQQRIIGLTLEQLGKVPKSVAVAYGEHKAQAILAVLKKQYVNHLVTDKKTVIKILELDNDSTFNN